MGKKPEKSKKGSHQQRLKCTKLKKVNLNLIKRRKELQGTFLLAALLTKLNLKELCLSVGEVSCVTQNTQL